MEIYNYLGQFKTIVNIPSIWLVAICLASPLCTVYDDDNDNNGIDNDDNIIIINFIEFKFTIYTSKVFYSKWAILLFCSRKYNILF